MDENDPIWTDLWTRRPFSESYNAAHKHTLHGGVAPAWGCNRNPWDMLVYQLWHNVRALHTYAGRVAREAERDAVPQAARPSPPSTQHRHTT
tara:strand:+ start:1110 stop:1385 length:276 start_codon:yes stop_codon:yes gene_type:complete